MQLYSEATPKFTIPLLSTHSVQPIKVTIVFYILPFSLQTSQFLKCTYSSQNVRTRAASRLERSSHHSKPFSRINILRDSYLRCLYKLENCLPLRQLFFFTQASQKSAKCRTNRTLALQSAKQVYHTIYCHHVQFPREELVLVFICVSECFCNYNDNDF